VLFNYIIVTYVIVIKLCKGVKLTVRSKHASCLPNVLFEQYSSLAAITQLGKYNCVINLNIQIGSLSYPSFGLDRCMKGSEPRPTGFKGLRTRGLYVGSNAVTAIAAGRRTA